MPEIWFQSFYYRNNNTLSDWHMLVFVTTNIFRREFNCSMFLIYSPSRKCHWNEMVLEEVRKVLEERCVTVVSFYITIRKGFQNICMFFLYIYIYLFIYCDAVWHCIMYLLQMTECHINTLNVKRNWILIFLLKGISCQVIHLAIILDKLCLNFQFSNTLRKLKWLQLKSGVYTCTL